ncbi:putative peptidoglycan muropeptide transporter SLC46 [Arctopsyche grandis]|uniref:putative peptidoglycan muropeptide transporter SLC46 n=1 Tax=Arctopsyche grandis TaxID=121162 RepID=UPI00406D8BB7
MDSKELQEQKVCLKPDAEGKEKVKDEEKPPSFRSKITLEPMWFGVTVSMVMGIFAFKNLFLQRACMVDLGYSEDICLRSVGEMRAKVELESQKIVSSLMVGSGFFAGFITSVLLIFLGPWSDSSGRRKPLIILPIIGILCTSLSMLIIQAFPNVPTVWVIYAEVLPLAIGGNFSMLIMAGFNYLGDVCYKTNRCPTMVMGSNSGFLSVYMVLGSLVGPFIIRSVGFTGVFGISILLEFTSLLYAIYKIQDVNVAEKMPKIIDFTLPLQVIKCVFKKREGNKRKIILLMIIVPCCNSMIYVSESSITYLYLRNKFAWTELEYGTLVGFRSIIHTFGTFVIVSIFKKRFNMRERYIGLIGGLSQMIVSIAFMFSFNIWALFGTAILGTLSRGAMIAERPVLNKQIQANEQGKVNCVTAVLEKCVSFIIIPLGNYIYSVTLTWLPSTYILLSALAGLIQIICYTFVSDEPTEIEMKNKNDPEKV